MAGSVASASQVAQAPLQAFGYHNQASPSLNIAPMPVPPGNSPGDSLTTQTAHLDSRSIQYLDEHVTQPRELLPHGLFVHDYRNGSQLTAAGPFAPPVPGDPHADQARFTLIGLNW
jgi:hypothetical protein